MATRYQSDTPFAVVHIPMHIWRNTVAMRSVTTTWLLVTATNIYTPTGVRVVQAVIRGKGIERTGIYRLHVQRMANGDVGVPLLEFLNEITDAREGEGGGPRYF